MATWPATDGSAAEKPSRAAATRLPLVDSSPRVGSDRHSAPGNGTAALDLDSLWREPPKHRPAQSGGANWLRSGTSIATQQEFERSLAQARDEYRVGAWLSAETSAWESLRWAAQSIDRSRQEAAAGPHPPVASAVANLKLARQAIVEARDFGGLVDSIDADAIARMARSHQTDVLDNKSTVGLTASDASDRYLDFARLQLAAIASHHAGTAEALDLLAAIYLQRGEARTLPSATALCLRRAALQGQPNSPSLAANLGLHLKQVGLFAEASWALQHSLSMQPNPETARALASVLRQRGHDDQAAAVIASIDPTPLAGTQAKIKVPEITQLTPDEFAMLSKSVVWPDAPSTTTVPPVATNGPDTRLASAEMNVQSPDTIVVAPAVPASDQAPDATTERPGVFQRAWSSWKRLID